MTDAIAPPVTTSSIINATCHVLALPKAAVLGERRTDELVYARRCIAWLARNRLSRTLNQIGNRLNRDHTTVLFGLGQLEMAIEAKPELQDQLDAIWALALTLEAGGMPAPIAPPAEAEPKAAVPPPDAAITVAPGPPRVEFNPATTHGSRQWFEINEARFRAGLAAAASKLATEAAHA